jgi:hypothetical protein
MEHGRKAMFRLWADRSESGGMLLKSSRKLVLWCLAGVWQRFEKIGTGSEIRQKPVDFTGIKKSLSDFYNALPERLDFRDMESSCFGVGSADSTDELDFQIHPSSG